MSIVLPLAPGAPVTGEAGEIRTARLRDAARQFEASLIGELTKAFSEKGVLFSDADPGSEESGADAVTGYGLEALARAMADRGGFGIARSIQAQIAKQGHAGPEANSEKS